jgi:hypothetical protein
MTLLRRFVGSVGGAAAYRDVAAGSMASMFGYLAVLIVLATAVYTVKSQPAINAFVREMTPMVREHTPPVHITQGKASSPVDQPFVLASRDEDAILIIDTTGATTEIDPSYEDSFLLTETTLTRHDASRGRTQTYNLQEFNRFWDPIDITGPILERWLAKWQRWGWVVVAVGSLCWLWLAKLVQVAVWWLLGLLINAVSGRRLRLEALFQLGIYALTVPFIFDVVKGVLDIRHGALALVSITLYVGYLIWAILVQPRPAAMQANA